MEIEGRTKVSQSKSAKKNEAQKKSSIRSLFSIFKSSGHKRDQKRDAEAAPPATAKSDVNRPLGPSLSTGSLPNTRPSTIESYAPVNEHNGLPTDIRPPFAHRPSSSSSTSSSYDLPSENSTPATTPSNSSSLSLRSGNPEAARSNASLNKAKRMSDSYKTSPLSNVKTARSYPYILPHNIAPPMPPAPPCAESDYSPPKRRNSLSVLMMRRAQSTPELAHEEDHAPMTMPRKNTHKRKGANKATEYTAQEKLEHKAILGADPVGFGFHRYPISEKDQFAPVRRAGPGPRRPGPGDSWKRNSWTGYDGDISRDPVNFAGNSRRGPRRDPRADFRRNVASQVIVEEGDVQDSSAQNLRRNSDIPGSSGAWSNTTPSEGSISAESSHHSISASESEKISPATSICSAPASKPVAPAITVAEVADVVSPLEEKAEAKPAEDESSSQVLRVLQQEAMKFLDNPTEPEKPMQCNPTGMLQLPMIK